MSEQSYQSAFFIVPSRILNLPGLQLAYLRIYETIFQFWNHGKPCYLKNEVISERTGIKSQSTIREAFMFFEKHGELKRVMKGNRRYLVQPERSIEIEEKLSTNDSTISVQGVAKSTGGRRQVDGLPVAKSTHNNNKINNKNINKSRRDERALIVDNFYPNEENQKLTDKIAIKCGVTGSYLLKKFIDIQKEYGTLSEDFNRNLTEFLLREKPQKRIRGA